MDRMRMARPTAGDVSVRSWPGRETCVRRAAESRIGKPPATDRIRTLQKLLGRLRFAPRWWKNWNRVSRCSPYWDGERHARVVVALAGPPGGGKTTTSGEVGGELWTGGPPAGACCLSDDSYRVAAAEQLRAYAAILGVNFQLVETTTALAQAIEENRGKELILIDTPGLGLAETADYSRLAQFMATRQDIDTRKWSYRPR